MGLLGNVVHTQKAAARYRLEKVGVFSAFSILDLYEKKLSSEISTYHFRSNHHIARSPRPQRRLRS